MLLHVLNEKHVIILECEMFLCTSHQNVAPKIHFGAGNKKKVLT